MRQGKCAVCGDAPFFKRRDIEWLCLYCSMWAAAAPLQPGGPAWGRDQSHRVHFGIPLDWLERAKRVNWPEAPLIGILKEIKGDFQG